MFLENRFQPSFSFPRIRYASHGGDLSHTLLQRARERDEPRSTTRRAIAPAQAGMRGHILPRGCSQNSMIAAALFWRRTLFIRISLKTCEACGILWFRAEDSIEVYCGTCARKMRRLPAPRASKTKAAETPGTPDTSKPRRGRPRRYPHRNVRGGAA